MRSGLLASPIELDDQESRALSNLGATFHEARQALTAMDGSLVLRQFSGGEHVWTFKHPTIGDAFATFVAEDPELMDVYLNWTRPSRLLDEVTCGNVGLEGVRVVVPRSRFRAFLARLDQVTDSRDVLRFLTTRCNAEFVALFAGDHPEILDRIGRAGPYLSASTEAALVCRLHEWGILPDKTRQLFADTALDLATSFPDLDCLAVPRIRAVFSDVQLKAILEAVRSYLVPRLRYVVDEWRDNFDSTSDSDEPEDYFQPLKDVLDHLLVEFPGDEGIRGVVADAASDILDAIDDFRRGRFDPVEIADPDDFEPSAVAPLSERSVFDDIAE